MQVLNSFYFLYNIGVFRSRLKGLEIDLMNKNGRHSSNLQKEIKKKTQLILKPSIIQGIYCMHLLRTFFFLKINLLPAFQKCLTSIYNQFLKLLSLSLTQKYNISCFVFRSLSWKPLQSFGCLKKYVHIQKHIQCTHCISLFVSHQFCGFCCWEVWIIINNLL